MILSHGHFNARVVLTRPEEKVLILALFPFPVHPCLYLVSSTEQGTKPNCPRDWGQGAADSSRFTLVLHFLSNGKVRGGRESRPGISDPLSKS